MYGLARRRRDRRHMYWSRSCPHPSKYYAMKCILINVFDMSSHLIATAPQNVYHSRAIAKALVWACWIKAETTSETHITKKPGLAALFTDFPVTKLNVYALAMKRVLFEVIMKLFETQSFVWFYSRSILNLWAILCWNCSNEIEMLFGSTFCHDVCDAGWRCVHSTSWRSGKTLLKVKAFLILTKRDILWVLSPSCSSLSLSFSLSLSLSLSLFLPPSSSFPRVLLFCIR